MFESTVIKNKLMHYHNNGKPNATFRFSVLKVALSTSATGRSLIISIFLCERWHEDEAKTYLLQRHHINADLIPLVSWQAMPYGLSKLSPHWRATVVKVIHRYLPTQEKLFKQGRVTMSSICP